MRHLLRRICSFLPSEEKMPGFGFLDSGIFSDFVTTAWRVTFVTPKVTKSIAPNPQPSLRVPCDARKIRRCGTRAKALRQSSLDHEFFFSSRLLPGHQVVLNLNQVMVVAILIAIYRKLTLPRKVALLQLAT